LVTETQDSLREKIVKWKRAMERKSLNTGKMKVMTGCIRKDKAEEKFKWLCSVFKKGVGYSILCNTRSCQ